MQNNMITGNVCSDISELPNDGIKFSLADEKWNINPEKIKTLFLSFSAFGSTAKYIKSNIKKGDQVIINYNIANNNFKDKEAGKDIYGYNFYVNSVERGRQSTRNT